MLGIHDGTNDIPIASLLVVANAGTEGTNVAAVSGLNATKMPYLEKDLAGNYFLPLAPGHKLRAKALATITGNVYILAQVGKLDV